MKSIAFLFSFIALASAADPLMRITCSSPACACGKAKAWEHGMISGNGCLGAVSLGNPGKEEIFLSDGRLHLPREISGTGYFELAKYGELAKELALSGREREIWDSVIERAAADAGGYRWKRDPFIGACKLVIETPGLEGPSPLYERSCDFRTGEITVKDGGYSRRLFVSRVDGLVAIKIDDPKERPFTVTLESISNGKPDNDRIVAVTREGDFLRYSVRFAKTNAKNPHSGYDVVALVKGREIFAVVEPATKGVRTDENLAIARIFLERASSLGYDRLLKRHAPVMAELMGRVSLELPGHDDIVRKFNACRYESISSVDPGKGIIPNLQGIWSGSRFAPWSGSYTVDGNLPAAISFWTMGDTPEFNEALFKWLMSLRGDFKEAARKGYGAKGIHIPGQVTTSGWETAYYRNVELMWWHGGAGWMTGHLWRWYRATGEMAVLRKVYPLLKDAADYYLTVLTPFPDGTLGFAPGYSPENAPKEGYSTFLSPTIDISAAKQAFCYARRAAEILGVDAADAQMWKSASQKLPKYRVSKDGYWAEWLVEDPPDNNDHRHASHLYALFDEAPAEILTNGAFTAAIKKTLDARMTFHESERHMAFGIAQLALAAAKVGDAKTMERAVNLIVSTYFSDALATMHDPGFVFNADLSGGFPRIVAESLITESPDGLAVLNAKPSSWTEGRISGLLLPDGRKVKELAWKGEKWRLTLLQGGAEKVYNTQTCLNGSNEGK